MKFTPGEIYFIQEYDPQTGRPTKYVKIGLVRNDRTTAERIKEHQTGNPRALKETKLIQTPAVDFVEKTLHQMFAECRISGGEWFIFTEAQLKECTEAAKNLVADVKKQESIFAAAEAFGTKRSKKATVAATKPLLALQKEYFEASYLIGELEGVIAKYERQLDEKAASGEDVAAARTQKEVTSRRFNESDFKASMPALYKKYVVMEQKVRGRFIMTANPDLRFTMAVINPRLEDFIAGFNNTIEQLKKNPKVLEVAKAKYSYIKGQVEIAKWRKIKAENQIKLACANNAGIDGICKWVRTAEEKPVFKVAALKSARPDIYEKFTVKKTVTRRTTKTGRTAAARKKR